MPRNFTVVSPVFCLLRLLFVLAIPVMLQPADAAAQEPAGTSVVAPTGVPRPELVSLEARDDCSCAGFNGGERASGVLWCGTSPSLGFRTLAERAAPILWFSPNEQAHKNNHNLPQPINCAELESECKPGFDEHIDPDKAAPATVYYHIHQVVQTTDLRANSPYTGESLNLEHIESLKLRYYFYYCHDVGFGDHDHDLEHVEMDVRVEKEREGNRYRVRLTRVKGAAHGIDWYANRHRVTDDTAFPVTILVERGKHASCPDADGDGEYEPGKDVNERVNDAWGVRDGLGEKDRILPTLPFYHRKQTDKREGSIRVGMKESKQRQCYEGTAKASPPKETSLFYDLAEFPAECKKKAAEVQRCSRFARGFQMACALKKRGIDGGPKRVKPHSGLEKLILASYSAEDFGDAWDGLPLYYRNDNGHGFSFILPVKRYELRWLGGGYIVPRAGLTGEGINRRYFIEGLFTPSASRYLGSYVSAGFERTRHQELEVFQNKFALEGGVKFRWKKYFPFAGARFGFRTSSFKRPRFIFEIGGGTF